MITENCGGAPSCIHYRNLATHFADANKFLPFTFAKELKDRQNYCYLLFIRFYKIILTSCWKWLTCSLRKLFIPFFAKYASSVNKILPNFKYISLYLGNSYFSIYLFDAYLRIISNAATRSKMPSANSRTLTNRAF